MLSSPLKIGLLTCNGLNTTLYVTENIQLLFRSKLAEQIHAVHTGSYVAPHLFYYRSSSILRLEYRKTVSRSTDCSLSFGRNNYTCNMMLTYFLTLHEAAKAMWFSLPFERSPHLRWLAPPWQLRRRMGHFRKSVTSGITYVGVLTKSAIHINTFFHMALGGKMSVQFRLGAGHFPVHLQQVTSLEKSMLYYFLKVYAGL